MKSYKNRLTAYFFVFVLACLSSSAVLVTATSFAASCGDTNTSIIECPKSNDQGQAIFAILLTVINIMAIGVGIAAVGGLAYASILYASARDEENKVSDAKTIIRNVVIGVVSFFLMYSFLQFIIPGGVFGNGTVAPAGTSGVASPRSNNGGSGSINGSNNGNSSDSGGSNNNGSPQKAIPKLTSVKNFRDASTSTGVLKNGVLIRSARLAEINSKDATALAKYLDGGIVIDLREKGTVKGKPDKSLDNVDNTNLPVTGTTNYTIFVTNASDRKSFGSAISLIASTDGKVLVHCTAGKDRTGWIVAMIMYAVGASDRQVMTEYMKSRDYGATVKESWLNAGLSKARSQYGSINNYLKEGLGLDDSTINQLKSKVKA